MKKFLLLLGFALLCIAGQAQLIAPFTESFDATSIPTGWTNTSSNTSTNANWKFSATPGNPNMSTSALYQPPVNLDLTGNAGSFAWVDGSTPNVDDTGLLTDSIDVSALTNPFVEFWFYSNNVTNAGDNMTLYVNFYDGTNWQDSVWGFAGDVNFWQYAGIDLSGFTITGNVVLEFVVDQTTAGTAFYNDILLDDFSVLERPACITPLVISNTSTTNVTADFQYTGTATSYSIIYGPADFDPATSGSVFNATSTTPTLPGLTATTTYDAYFISNCGAASSDTSGGIRFTTQVNCPEPSGLTLTATTTTTATIDWTSGGSSAWVVEYGSPGFTPGTGTVLSASSNVGFVISPLTAGTYYDVYVRDYCASFSDTSNYVGPLVVQTSCVPTTVTYSNDFESEVDGLLPACWLQYTNVSNGYARTENLGAPRSGTQQLAIYSGSSSAGDTIAAISPQLSDLNVGDKQLRFFAKTSNASTDLVLGTLSSTDITTATFTLLDTIKFAATNVYEEIIYAISTANGYNGTDEYVVFLNTAGTTFDYIYIDDFNYETVPACPKVLATTGDNITPFAFDLQFNGTGGTNFEYELGPTGFVQGTNSAAIVGITNDTVTIANLNPNTTYDIYVRKDCGVNGVSVWDGPFTFTTGCFFTAPFTEDFETYTEGQAGANIVGCFSGSRTGDPDWTVDVSTGANANSLNTGPFTDGSGSNSGFYLFLETSGGTNGTADSIISPFIYVGNLTVPSVEFNYHMYGAQMGDLVVEINDGTGWVNLTTLSGQQQTAGGDPWGLSRTAPTLTSDTIRLKFKGIKGTGLASDMSIDNISVVEAPACVPPTNASLGAFGISASSASVYWGAGSQGDRTIVEIGNASFIPGTGTAVASANVAGTVDTVLNLGGLAAQTSYEFYVRDSCAVGGLSAWAGPFAFTTACSVQPTPYTENFDGTSWTPGTGLNNNGFTTGLCWTATPDETVTSAFQWGARNSGTSSGSTGPTVDATGGNYIYTEASNGGAGNIADLVSPLIDLGGLVRPALYFDLHRAGTNLPDLDVSVSNDNGVTWTTVFTLSGSIQSAIADPWEEQFVNLDSYGTDTIQVRFRQTSAGCCGDGALDNIRLIDGPACPDASLLGLQSLSDTSATLSWTGSSGAVNYQVWFGPQGFYQGTATAAGVGFQNLGSADSLIVDTLSPNTCYEFVVKTYCSGTDSTDYVGPFQFCTPCAAFFAPYSENFDGTTAPTMTACWTALNNGTSTLSNVGTSTLRSVSTPNSIEIEYWTGTGEQILASPLLGDFDSLKSIRFSVWDDDNTSDLIVGTMSNPSDASTFTPFRTITAAEMPNQQWEEFRIYFGEYSGNDKYVAFSHGQNTTTDQFYIDDFVYEQPTCFDPIFFTSSARTSTSITLSWTSGGATSWEVEYGPVGFTPGTGAGTIVATTTNTNYVLSSLSPGTAYDIYVRDVCSSTDKSAWAGPVSDYTDCAGPLSGNYTIGATGDYPTFNAAANALGICGVSGPVVFTAQAGTYTDRLHLEGIPGVRRGVVGVSATNTITFDGNNVATLIWDGQGVQSSVWIDSVSYVTITNMTIENNAASEGWNILITDNSDDISITNNTLLMDSTGIFVSDKGNIVVSGATDNDQVLGADVDNLTITDNEIYGGNISVSIYGESTTSRNSTVNVSNNTIGNFYFTGLFFSYIEDITVVGNTINSTNSVTDEDGLYLLDCEDYTVTENNIHVKDWGIYVFDGNDGATLTSNSLLINNMVISENDYGMYLNDIENTDVFHNSVKGEPALRINDQINLNVQNNIFATDNDFAFESDDNLNATDEVNYNLYYRASTGDPFDIGTAGTYADLAAWQAGDATKNANSLEGDPIFVSASDLHLIGGLANDVGNNTLGITADIDGDARPATGSTIVDIGADEYTPVSGDFALILAEFTKNGFCLQTNDTITLFAENIVGASSDLSTTPLVANYTVTGPNNSSGTITLNTGVIALNDTAIFQATNIDLSVPGNYTLNAFILPNADNALAINDTLAFNSVTITVDSILVVEPKSTVTLGANDELPIVARSPFFGGGSFHFTEIMHFRTATGSPTGGWPSYMGTNGTDLDEYVEITGVPGADLAGYTFEQWNTTGAAPTGTITFPAGTVMGPNGTALFTMRGTFVTSPGDFLYDGSGGNTVNWQSGGAQGVVLKDPNGNIVDAVGYPSSGGAYTFPPAANVPASAWAGGTPGSASGTCGVRLEGPDNDDATGWVVSSAASPQDPNIVNTGVVVPAPVSVTGFTWSLNGTTTTTDAVDTVFANQLTPGTYTYIATYNSPCGIYSDSVTVIIPSCFAPNVDSVSAAALSSSSATISWDTTGLGSATNYEIEYGPIGYTAGSGTIVAVSANNTGVITNLTQNVCVDVYLRTACSSTDFSPWVGPVKACPLVVPCDDMDGYAAGLVSDEESALFIEWQGAGGDAAFSTTRAQSGSNSLHIVDTDGATGPQFSDVVAYFDTIDNGAWDISFSMYVETGDGAYYNVQQNHVITGATGTNLWGCDIYFDNTGTATVQYANPATTVGTFTYAQGQWIDINTVIDLDNDTIWVEYNGASTGLGWAYSAANPTGPLQFNGVNFFSGVLAPGTYDIDFYVDDFCVTARAGSCPMPAIATVGNIDCDNVDVNFTSSTGSSIVQYGPAGFTLGSGSFSAILTGATTFNVPGLTVNTNYDVYVANICASGDTSMFAGPLTITPTGPAPVASFSVVSLTGFAGSFDATTSTGGNLTYSWNFGDGSPAGSGATVGHTFLAGGSISVTLTVSNACGSDDTTIVLSNVSLIENPLSQSLSIYPNPSEGQVNIGFAAFDKNEAIVRIIDLRGKEVRRFALKENDGEFKSVLDISELARGVYSLEVTTAEFTAIQKLIKQ